jgi:primase-polymerase (primpol)-like protein
MQDNDKVDADQKKEKKTKEKLPDIPNELKEQDNWVVWKKINKPDTDKITKIPKTLMKGSIKNSDSTDSSTWLNYSKAKKVKNKCNDLDGLGFVFTASKYAGIDLDDCRDPETGELSDKAEEIVERMNSYTEVSPSGKGLHIIIKGGLPSSGGRRTDDIGGMKQIEMYDSGRYFTMTGNKLDETPGYINDNQSEFSNLFKEVFENPREDNYSTTFENSSDNNLSDKDIIEIARNAENGEEFKRLYQKGDTSSYPSPSEADEALCFHLAFYTKDYNQIERLFNRSELTREKWLKREDYRKRTIKKAIENVQAGYDPNYYERKDNNKTEDVDNESGLNSMHKKLQAIAEEAELYKMPDNRNFAKVEDIDGENKILMISGGKNCQFTSWLKRKYFDEYEEYPSSTPLSRVVDGIKSRAEIADMKELHMRATKNNNSIYVDLAQNNLKKIKISPDGYKIVENEKVEFLQNDEISKLPEPSQEAGIESLKKLNELTMLEGRKLVLIISWLTSVYYTPGSYPILIITGEAGSGKSVLSKMLRFLVDPAGIDGKEVIESINDNRGINGIALNRHVVARENISRISQTENDTLSAISTGTSQGARSMYTNFGVDTIRVKNPIILNGINITGIKSDLLDRSIMIRKEKIKSNKNESQIWRRVNEYHPEILGGLCKLISQGVSRLKKIDLSDKEKTRMANYSEWLEAISGPMQKIPGLENIHPLDAYKRNRRNAGEIAMDSGAFTKAIKECLKSKARTEDKSEGEVVFKGSATEVLREMEDFSTPEQRESKQWPSSPVSAGRRLERIKTTLRKIGFKHKKNDNGDERQHIFIKND